MTPYIVCIDGLIGAGKTSLITRLQKHFRCFSEPLSQWTLLPYLYQNPSLYGFPFQLQVLLSQFHHSQAFPDGMVVVERCPFTSRHVFAPLLLQDDDLSLYHTLYQRFQYSVDFFIYLDIDPLLAYRRLRTRSSLDRRIPLDYLQRLHARYLTHLVLGRSNLCVVDAYQPLDVVEEQVTRLLFSLP